MKFLIALLCLATCVSAENRVHALKIEVLSTMLTSDDGIGEWGFSAIVDADGHRMLFDTGDRPDTVVNNAKELHVDLSNVPVVILSHNHGDHTGGFLTLRSKYPESFGTMYAGKGIFFPRRDEKGRPLNAMLKRREAYEQSGGHIIEIDKVAEIYPGVWLTGPVPRKYPERNWSGTGQVQTASGWQEDNIPEDMSLVFNTDQGLVVLSGCGHSGVVNTVDYARDRIRKAPLYAAIGGFHLYELNDERLQWTAEKLREFGLQNFLGAHCTGIEAVYRIRQLTGLTRQTASVAAVGAVFELGKPMNPGSIAH